jgi:tetratricopeptide (TPR) repeat protein
MWSQLLIVVLLNISQSDFSKEEMLNECREYYKDNEVELKKINKFENEYQTGESIYWYTLDSFVYRLLNKALRTQNIDIIFKFRFFISGLYHQLNEQHHSYIKSLNTDSDHLTFYRGQRMTTNEFNKIKNSINSYIASNTFFSTTTNSNMAVDFSGNGFGRSRGIESVVFEIHIDIKLRIKPFSDISHLSHMKENEILFSMGTIFKISDVYQMTSTSDVWIVELNMSTNEDERKIKELRNYLENEINEENPIQSLGSVLVSMGQYDKAEKYFHMILEDGHLNFLENELNFYNSMGLLEYKRGNYLLGLDYFHKAYLYVTLTKNKKNLAITYLNLGTVYFALDEFDDAIEHFEEAIKLQSELSIVEDLQWAYAYSSLAMAWNRQANYEKAMGYFEKSLVLFLSKLPFNHPQLADIHNNIACLHCDLGEYSLAKKNYEKSLNIQLVVLPNNHPSLGETYNNLGGVQAILGEYEEALQNYENALGIRVRNLSNNHPSIANTHINIGTLHFDNGNYTAALQSYERSLQIQLISLHPNHASVGLTYSSMGTVLVKLQRYDEALIHFEKALEIKLAKLPKNHPSISNTYCGLGTVYFNLNRNSEALVYFEKVLHIRQEILPPLHKDLAEIYVNIAVVHDSNGDYFQALGLFQKALAIYNQSLSPHHQLTAITLGNVGRAYLNLEYYDEAMLHHLKALNILHQTIPVNYHHLSITYNNIAAVLEAIGNYKAAIETYEKCFRIELSVNKMNPAASICAYAKTVLVCCRIGKLSNWCLV